VRPWPVVLENRPERSKLALSELLDATPQSRAGLNAGRAWCRQCWTLMPEKATFCTWFSVLAAESKSTPKAFQVPNLKNEVRRTVAV
jgi:hypothetical protein